MRLLEASWGVVAEEIAGCHDGDSRLLVRCASGTKIADSFTRHTDTGAFTTHAIEVQAKKGNRALTAEKVVHCDEAKPGVPEGFEIHMLVCSSYVLHEDAQYVLVSMQRVVTREHSFARGLG